MHITFFPICKAGNPCLERRGDALVIDGEVFDFSALPEGASLPAEAVATDWICGEVARIDGVLHLPVLLCHGRGAPQEIRFPAPLTVNCDGPINLPGDPLKPSFTKADHT